MSVALDVDGPAAPPRDNGELVFAAPWEGRAFALVMALHEGGAFAWDEFRDRLVARIGAGEGAYYESWLAALQDVVAERGIVSVDDLAARAVVLGERPVGHDHVPGTGHGHGH